jgi:hypothetical protein
MRPNPLSPFPTLSDHQAELADVDELMHDQCGIGILTPAEESELTRDVWAAAAAIRLQRPRPAVRTTSLPPRRPNVR